MSAKCNKINAYRLGDAAKRYRLIEASPERLAVQLCAHQKSRELRE